MTMTWNIGVLFGLIMIGLAIMTSGVLASVLECVCRRKFLDITNTRGWPLLVGGVIVCLTTIAVGLLWLGYHVLTSGNLP